MDRYQFDLDRVEVEDVIEALDKLILERQKDFQDIRNFINTSNPGIIHYVDYLCSETELGSRWIRSLELRGKLREICPKIII